MTGEPLALSDVVVETEAVGGAWALAHARRLISLISLIGARVSHDESVIELAAYLHYWGAFPAHRVEGVEHAERAHELVAAEVLPRLRLTAAQEDALLESIALHDYRDARPTTTPEALLLREADMLDFLGAIGIARDFARGPKDLPACRDRVLARHDAIRGRFTLPEAQRIAEARFTQTQDFLSALDQDSFGHL
jgi:HD superfamily phosphodiesterase